jgi:hypothetical protein
MTDADAYRLGWEHAIALIRLGPPPGVDVRPWAAVANTLQGHVDEVLTPGGSQYDPRPV